MLHGASGILMTYSYIEYRWSVRSVVLSHNKKVRKFEKKNDVNIIGSSNHAGAGFAFMGSLLLHHSDRCMDALVLSNDQIQMRDVKQKQLWEIQLENRSRHLCRPGSEKNITLSLSNNFHQHWRGKSSSRRCYITWLGAYLFIALSKNEFALRNSR